MLIYVIDTETTGLSGYPEDVVIEIGIAEVDTETLTVEPAFESLVGYDTDQWCDRWKESWIFSHSTLNLKDLRTAPKLKDVVDQVRYLLVGENVTSYNMPFDFKKYLDRKPWDLKKFGCVKMPDIMEAAADYFKEPSPFGGYRWPRLERTYRTLCKDDPAGINNKQEHRALSDAIAAGYVLLALYKAGTYKIDEKV